MFIILCSYENYESLENLNIWLEHISSISRNLNKNNTHFLPILILVNKSDLKNNEKKFKFSDVNKRIKNFNLSISFYQFSAKETNGNSKEIFDRIEGFLMENTEKEKENKEVQSNFNNETTSTNLLRKSFSENGEKRNTFKITRKSLIDKSGNKSNSCC